MDFGSSFNFVGYFDSLDDRVCDLGVVEIAMTYRPQYPKTDTNHSLVTRVLEGLGHYLYGKQLYALDTSSLGGESLDWIVWVGPIAISIEVKRPGDRKRLTDGEKAFISNCPGPKHVVTDEEELVALLQYYAAFDLMEWT